MAGMSMSPYNSPHALPPTGMLPPTGGKKQKFVTQRIKQQVDILVDEADNEFA